MRPRVGERRKGTRTKTKQKKYYSGKKKKHTFKSQVIVSNLQKEENRKLASEKIVIEHVYRHLKIFRILSQGYRNRRKRFGLRFNLSV